MTAEDARRPARPTDGRDGAAKPHPDERHDDGHQGGKRRHARRRPGEDPGQGAEGPAGKPAVAEGEAKAERKPRTDTKQAKLIAMLQAKDGATVEEIADGLRLAGPHRPRRPLRRLKKKLGLDVTSEKVEGRGRVYRIGN